MAIRDALLPEFDVATASTRKRLERVPESGVYGPSADEQGS
jgi:hypothetical protein